VTDAAPLLLMTPGPTRVPARVLRAGSRPMIHHRTPEFSSELALMLELLPPLFGTRGPVLPVHATGRGALEATIANLFSPGDEIAVCCNGRFGGLWARIAESLGLVVHRIATDWEHDVDPQEVDRKLSEHPNARAVALPHSDTSTGVANDVGAVAAVARAHDALVLVDGVSSVGGMPFAFDEWEVDVAVTASQKCLMSSPGLSFAVVSERARAVSRTARLPHGYWDFEDIRRNVTKPKPETPGTPPVHLVLQVVEALRMIHTEGLELVYGRHDTMARSVRAGAASLGLTLQCPELQRRSTTLTGISLPGDLPPDQVRQRLKTRGILTAAGLEHYRETAFRIGHMGDIRSDDVTATLDALGAVLQELRAESAFLALGNRPT
jgi:aspartate aminotransferase-like enzyme